MPITGEFNNQRLWEVNITGLLQSQTSDIFTLGASEQARVQATGTFGGTSIMVQGSNDEGVTWVNALASAMTTQTALNIDVNFDLYRVVLTGGNGTTLIACRIMSRTVT